MAKQATDRSTGRVFLDVHPAGRHRRGIGWVLRGAFSLVVYAAVMLVLFYSAGLVRANLALHRAVQAGALEATLPRASRATVQQVVASRLGESGMAGGLQPVLLERNAAAVLRGVRPRAGDRLAVTVAMSTADVLPGWLPGRHWLLPGRLLVARAERVYAAPQ